MMDATLVNGIETFETETLIVGGGATGTGVMRDLALRGIHCLLIDRIDLNAGASGGNQACCTAADVMPRPTPRPPPSAAKKATS